MKFEIWITVPEPAEEPASIVPDPQMEFDFSEGLQDASKEMVDERD
jgi:hypothetical protein